MKKGELQGALMISDEVCETQKNTKRLLRSNLQKAELFLGCQNADESFLKVKNQRTKGASVMLAKAPKKHSN